MNGNQLFALAQINRRQFLKQGLVLGAGIAACETIALRGAGGSANEKLVVGVMGLGRGMGHIEVILEIPNTELAYVSDVDERRMEAALKTIAQKGPQPPKAVQDFRRILEDKAVDALFIAACNHWHAPATILACAAGKHVYVEKPGSHNAREGELMVAAARKYNRVVQQGTQRRSYPGIREGIQKLHEGAIGRVFYARCWYNNARPAIGRGKPVPIPAHLDYSLWQGPAPERPYKDNLVHYNWHWHWHWGGGELANNGVHYLDLVRWGLGVDYPHRITYNGGRYHYQDDQETPDTGVVTFDFGNQGASWEHSSCHPRKAEKFSLVSFYGEEGTLALDGGGYTIYDQDGKPVQRSAAPGSDTPHIANFLDCVRTGRRPNANIEEGQKSTLLCHLGNIAYRTGRTIHFDPQTRRIIGDKDALALWDREYRPGWEPTV
jgi:predicted dehydrogenase